MASARRVLVIDNGGSHIKAGFGGEASPALIVPNCTARVRRQLRLLVADETETSRVKGERGGGAATAAGFPQGTRG